MRVQRKGHTWVILTPTREARVPGPAGSCALPPGGVPSAQPAREEGFWGWTDAGWSASPDALMTFPTSQSAGEYLRRNGHRMT